MLSEKDIKVKEKSFVIKSWFLNQIINNRILILLIITLVVIIFMSAMYPDIFFTYQNFGAIMLNLSTSGILAVGMMYLIVGGAFDISIGANLALGAAVAAYIMMRVTAFEVPVFIAALAGIAVSAFVGLVNGLIVTKVKVNALITTLGMMSICRALSIIITGSGIANLPESFLSFGQSVFFRLQMPAYYLIFITVVGHFILKKTGYFRKLYYIGANANAAKLSGINVTKIMLTTFIIMGMLAGFTGVVVAARLNAAVGTIMEWINLQVIAAVVLGGGSLAGGRGSILGAFLGSLFMALIRNMMVISGISIYLQSGIIGFVLIAVLAIDVTLIRRYGGVK